MERDTIIDGVLSLMVFGRVYEFIDLWRKFDSGPMVKFAAHEDVRICLSEMTENDLVTISPTFSTKVPAFNDPPSPINVTLTLKGQKIKESGGWLKYRKSIINKVSGWLDTGGKMIAILEGLVIIILTPYAVYLQVKNGTMETDNKSLKEVNVKIQGQNDSLRTAIKTRLAEPDSMRSK